MLDIKHRPVTSALTIAAPPSIGAIALTSCLRVNPEHCIAAGGDLACDDQVCVLTVGKEPEHTENGCVDEVPAGFIHVKYGLPSRMGTVEDNTLDTLTGVLKATVGEEIGLSNNCSVADATTSRLYDEWLGARAVRAYLDQRRVRKKAVELTQDHVEAVLLFNEAIDAWLAECSLTVTNGTVADAGTEGSSSTSMAESTETTSGPSGCVVDEDCAGTGMLFCEPSSGMCVHCSEVSSPDDACAQRDPATPVCADATCVQCTVDDAFTCETQRCDEGLNVCRPACDAHDQCVSGACELAVGACFPMGPILHVDGDGGREFLDIQSAVATVPSDGFGVIVVHEQSSGAYVGNIVIDQGKNIALLGATDEDPVIEGLGTTLAGLRVWDDYTKVYVDELELSSAGAQGLFVNEGMAWVDRSRITQNSTGNVVAMNGADLVLRNCFVGDALSTSSVRVDGSTASILYTTVGTGTGGGVGLSCQSPVEVTVRNSILMATNILMLPGDDLDCPEAALSHTATVDNGNLATGTVGVGYVPSDPSLWFTDYTTGDFHLHNEGVTIFGEIAEWQAGDPTTDIDGDPRPNSDSSPDYAGADVP